MIPPNTRISKDCSMTDAPETISVTETRIACDGGKGEPALGHPRVFLQIGEEGFAECPYCDKRFVLAEGAHGHAH